VKHLPQHIQKHIQAIAEQEKAFQSRKSVMARIGHAVGGFVGSSSFIALHVVWFTAWLLLNLAPPSQLKPFDPFPFPLLGSIIEIEGIFLASFILIRQNEMNRRSDERDHLALQILLLAEQEITTLLDIERRKSIHNDIPDIANDENIKSLSEPTSVDELQRKLQEHMPQE
jgi:uncharacterized membrane protein